MAEIIDPSFEILSPFVEEDMLRRLELYGRVCYKSEDRITEESARRFVQMLIDKGHESVLEHCSITVRIICDRGVTHQLVRHRLASYSQESTRYCNYAKKGLKFIRSVAFEEGTPEHEIWKSSLERAEEAYNRLLSLGATPEQARDVLPTALKSEIVMTCNVRQWRHIFRERALNPAAHPQMKLIMFRIYEKFREISSVLFDLGKEKEK